jgi:phosphoglycolate phosphatase-like HAD superfamily hydrolase
MNSEPVRKTRFVHLGDRLLAIGRVRSGMLTVEEAAAELGVHPQDVIEWQQVHAFERMVTLEELRTIRSPLVDRLGRRAQQLAELVADAEKELRGLHQELIRRAIASNDPFDGAKAVAKKLG